MNWSYGVTDSIQFVLIEEHLEVFVYKDGRAVLYIDDLHSIYLQFESANLAKIEIEAALSS